MDSTQRKAINIKLGLILLILGIFIFSPLMSRGEFVDMFTKDKYDVSEQARAYIESCCNDRDSVVTLLEKNGFQLFIKNEPTEVERINRQYDQSRRSWPSDMQMDFDEFISGTRAPVFWRFWDIFATYNVSVFIKDKKIIRVTARVERTMP